MTAPNPEPVLVSFRRLRLGVNVDGPGCNLMRPFERPYLSKQ